MRIRYLEIVTPDVDGVCALYAGSLGVSFGEPVPELGQARTAPLPDGGQLGVRAPMHDAEQPVVRPYALVDDVEAATSAAAAAGAEVAMAPTELPGQGRFSIVIQGGLQQGYWQD